MHVWSGRHASRREGAQTDATATGAEKKAGGRKTAAATVHGLDRGKAHHTPHTRVEAGRGAGEPEELVQRCGVNPKYEEVAREQGGPPGAARVHVKVSAQGVLLGESVLQVTNFRQVPTLTGCRLAAEAAVKAWAERRPLVLAAKEADKVAAAAAAAVVASAAAAVDGAEAMSLD
ncbi:hypothetical protein ABPG75_009477 [Micractinium tetrahymenae]